MNPNVRRLIGFCCSVGWWLVRLSYVLKMLQFHASIGAFVTYPLFHFQRFIKKEASSPTGTLKYKLSTFYDKKADGGLTIQPSNQPTNRRTEGFIGELLFQLLAFISILDNLSLTSIYQSNQATVQIFMHGAATTDNRLNCPSVPLCLSVIMTNVGFRELQLVHLRCLRFKQKERIGKNTTRSIKRYYQEESELIRNFSKTLFVGTYH